MLTLERYIELGGNKDISLELFNRYKLRLETEIKFYVFDRLDFENEKHIKMYEKCLTELINLVDDNLKNLEDMSNSTKSETIGRQSITYGDNSDLVKREIRNEELRVYKIIKKHFGLSGLMYRGA